MPRWCTTSVRVRARQDIWPAVAGAAHRRSVDAAVDAPVEEEALEVLPAAGAAATEGAATATRPPVTRAPVATTATAARRTARLNRPGLNCDDNCNELPSMGDRLRGRPHRGRICQGHDNRS